MRSSFSPSKTYHVCSLGQHNNNSNKYFTTYLPTYLYIRYKHVNWHTLLPIGPESKYDLQYPVTRKTPPYLHMDETCSPTSTHQINNTLILPPPQTPTLPPFLLPKPTWQQWQMTSAAVLAVSSPSLNLTCTFHSTSYKKVSIQQLRSTIHHQCSVVNQVPYTKIR